MTNLDSILKSRDICANVILDFANKGLSSQSHCFSGSHVWIRSGTIEKAKTEELMLLNCGVGEDS